MRYNMANIMRRAWELCRSSAYTFATCLRLAWAEAKGLKRYTFNMENARASITAYIVKLMSCIKDEHDEHKLACLRDALQVPVDAFGVAVLEGKAVGLCKYAVRNA